MYDSNTIAFPFDRGRLVSAPNYWGRIAAKALKFFFIMVSSLLLTFVRPMFIRLIPILHVINRSTIAVYPK